MSGLWPQPWAGAVISRRGADRLKTGHPWIYRSDIEEPPPESSQGCPVLAKTARGRPLGVALYSRHSQIALRFVDGLEPGRAEEWLAASLRTACEARAPFAEQTAARLVHAESDNLPGLIVDRYGPVAAAQTNCAAMEHAKPFIADWLAALPGVSCVAERNDSATRSLEGLERVRGVLRGALPEEVVITEGGARFPVDILQGQKTGAFLDHARNRARFSALTFGDALDAFAYEGWLSVQAAARAKRVAAVDGSAHAVERIRSNARLNQRDNVEAVESNVFDYLRQCDLSGIRFDSIALDPPAFARTRDTAEKGAAGYKEINLRALKIIRPGGLFMTTSCSHHLSRADFEAVVAAAAADARRRVTVIEILSQAPDHPVRLNFPESFYLKGLLCRVT
ncbi:MAG: Ribosomal RNA large subunit methyltransferase I [Myxococcota bacterium]|nr:Ribosomal RNA large subunit methyltransferase I [Myxococcota bacterium]